MAALAELDASLRGGSGGGAAGGAAAAAAALGKRGKPAARVCPLCGEAVGVSASSLDFHLRARHKSAAAPPPPPNGAAGRAPAARDPGSAR
jgi:hypothetical protein